ncbi:MAG TPA: LptF/LptG family permease [Tepidisphaeraceae bacterium]|nr:LptF/LptG family permease [Tepidisphaeraceae bacterium]
MRIIDRYVFFSFLRNYLISFMVLIGMYVVLDMVFHFDELADVDSISDAGGLASTLEMLKNIVDYYFYQSFLFFVHLSGIIPVVAAAFTLLRLSRFNELTALLAAGVPLLRVAAPVIIASVVLNALLIVDQELVIPEMIPKLSRSHNEMHKGSNHFPVQAIQDENNALLYAARFLPPGARHQGEPPVTKPTMKEVDVIERDEKLTPVAKITAPSAEWDQRQGVWKLNNATRVAGLHPNARTSTETVSVWATSITPQEIDLYRNTDFVELLSTERINQLIDRPKSFGTANLQRVKHSRFTQPIMNVILLLLAIPCVLTREPGKLKQGATICLLLTGLAMGSIFMCQQIANTPPKPELAAQWPAVMAWVPIFLFGPLSVYLLDRIKT